MKARESKIVIISDFEDKTCDSFNCILSDAAKDNFELKDIKIYDTKNESGQITHHILFWFLRDRE